MKLLFLLLLPFSVLAQDSTRVPQIPNGAPVYVATPSGVRTAINGTVTYLDTAAFDGNGTTIPITIKPAFIINFLKSLPGYSNSPNIYLRGDFTWGELTTKTNSNEIFNVATLYYTDDKRRSAGQYIPIR